MNLAATLILSSPGARDEGVTRYAQLYEAIRSEEIARDDWTDFTLGECAFGKGNEADAARHFDQAFERGMPPQCFESTAAQLELFERADFRVEEARRLIVRLRQHAERLRIPRQQGMDGPAVPGGQKDDVPQPRARMPVLIHLSDLHFGKTKDGSRDMHRFLANANSTPLSEQLREEFTGADAHFDSKDKLLHLVVSGDLTYVGTEPEFQLALRSLTEICDALKLDKRRVHIIPGNHDVNWTLSMDNKQKRFEYYLRFLYKFYGKDVCTEKYPEIAWPLGFEAEFPQPEEIVSVVYDRESQLVIASFNSCVYETEQDHYGFIGYGQVKKVKKKLQKLALGPEVVRVALIHHHLHSYPEPLSDKDPKDVWLDLSATRDAAYVERQLEEMEFDLVLHGHKHAPQLRESTLRDSTTNFTNFKRLIICGAGTVSCTDAGDNRNHYQVIEFRQIPRRPDADFVTVEWRTLTQALDADWQTTKKWPIKG